MSQILIGVVIGLVTFYAAWRWFLKPNLTAKLTREVTLQGLALENERDERDRLQLQVGTVYGAILAAASRKNIPLDAPRDQPHLSLSLLPHRNKAEFDEQIIRLSACLKKTDDGLGWEGTPVVVVRVRDSGHYHFRGSIYLGNEEWEDFTDLTEMAAAATKAVEQWSA